MHRLALPLVVIAFGFWSPSPVQPRSVSPRNDSSTKEELKADLVFLASDVMKGRRTNTPENFIAAEFIKSRFEYVGLKPAGPGGSYYQTFNLLTAGLGPENMLEVSHGANASLRLRPRQEYYPHRFSASARVTGPVVFVGFGITAPDLGYDDYQGDSFKGKVVLVLDSEPGANDPASPFEGRVRSEYSSQLSKALTAQHKGAIGILFVQDVHNRGRAGNFEGQARGYWPESPGGRQRYTLGKWVEQIRIPAAQISPYLAETLVQAMDRSFREIAQSAETEQGFTPIPLPGIEVELTTSVNRHIVPDRNVVGLIEGSDESVKDEWVILCAHYDHTGVDGSGRVYNGADDDGSGTVALFEIAQAYALAAREGKRPRRSVLFAAWDSEEVGLLGAWAYAEDPLTPLEKTVAVLNMDMIGRNQEVPEGGGRRFRGMEIQSAESNRNSLNIIGHTYSEDLLSEVNRANRYFNLEIETGYDDNLSSIIRRSDHWPFLQHGVPAILLTTGFHPDYHQVTDDVGRINFEKMEKIVRLTHQMSWNLAQQDSRPKMNSGKTKSKTR